MPENPAFDLLGWVADCVRGRGGGAGLLFEPDDVVAVPLDRGGIDGFLAIATGATLAGAGSFHELFTSLISQLFVE